MTPDEIQDDVRFQLKERDRLGIWDVIIIDQNGRKVTGIGPFDWDEAVKQCNICQRIRHDFLKMLEGEK